MKITYLKDVNTIEELKKSYKQLAKKFHPDLNRDTDTGEIMVAINNEYDYLFPRLTSDKDKKAGHKIDDNFRSVVDELLKEKFSAITIEIVGSWIWVSGDTYSVKEDIKALGFKWSKNNKKWYLGEVTSSKKKGSMSWKKKVETFGVETVQQAVKKTVLIG
jgi:hypothetical protein